MSLTGLLNQSQRAQRHPLVMGIVNVTPDSFSDGGQFDGVDTALAHARQLVADGADVLDIGGESTRPGAEIVSIELEIARVVPVIEAIRAEWAGIISIDTMKPEVARAAVTAGATVWNDVTGLGYSEHSPAVAAELGVEIILMHMLGDPKTMQDAPAYEDVTTEVMAHLAACAEVAIEAGVSPEKIWLDPGIGFAKTTAHNLQLTADLSDICDLGYPVLYAASRKRMIAQIDPSASSASDRLGGSLALHLEAVNRGAAMVRVHDVRETVQALKVKAAIRACEETL